MSHAATGKAAHRKRGYIQRNLRRNWPLYTMVLPAVVLIFIFSYIPMYGIVMAFQQFKPSLGFFHSAWARPLYRYFEQVITDPYFARVFRNTVVLGVLNLLWSFPAPILLALLFNEMRSPRFKKITQTISYLPYFISTVVVIGMMKLLFQDNGPIASVLRNMGFDWTNPFMLPSAFRTLYIGSSLWTGVGYNSIIYLAAISGISQDLYESAVIDGAKPLSAGRAHHAAFAVADHHHFVHFRHPRRRGQRFEQDPAHVQRSNLCHCRCAGHLYLSQGYPGQQLQLFRGGGAVHHRDLRGAAHGHQLRGAQAGRHQPVVRRELYAKGEAWLERV